MMSSLQVTYKSTRNAYQAKQFLQEIEKYDVIACDFEVAVKYTQQDYDQLKQELEHPDTSYLRSREIESKLKATALDHPSHTTLTHLSVAVSESESYVFIIDNISLERYLLNWLTTTSTKQVWHNASYDFKHIRYRTGTLPINYEDTQILGKTLINHVETYKAKTGLKELAGHAYGAWGISADYFTIDEMYNKDVLLYAAIDACATMYLWNRNQEYLNE